MNVSTDDTDESSDQEVTPKKGVSGKGRKSINLSKSENCPKVGKVRCAIGFITNFRF